MAMLDRVTDLPFVYAIRADGEVIQGHAKSVEYERDIEPMTWCRRRVSVATASRMIIDFEEHGETLVDFYANDMRVIDRELEQRAAEAREWRRSARIRADRVTVDRLVGHRITRIQGDSEILAFHLSDESVWAFQPSEGTWDGCRNPGLAIGGKVSRVETDGCLRIFVEGSTVPAVFWQEPDYEDSEFGVSTAFEPSRGFLESTPELP